MAAKKKTTSKKNEYSVASRKGLGAQCTCIEKMNEAIARDVHPNLMLSTGFSLKCGSLIVIPITKKEEGLRMPPGKNVKTITAGYCPFCGKKYNLE